MVKSSVQVKVAEELFTLSQCKPKTRQWLQLATFGVTLTLLHPNFYILEKTT